MPSSVLVRGESAPLPRAREARAVVRVTRLEPWSVLKTSFFFSFLAAVASFLAVAGAWALLSASGLMAKADGMIEQLTGVPASEGGLALEQFLSTPRVLGAAALLGAVLAVAVPAVLTLSAAFFNFTSHFLGGVEVTLAQDAGPEEAGEAPEAPEESPEVLLLPTERGAEVPPLEDTAPLEAVFRKPQGENGERAPQEGEEPQEEALPPL